MKEQKTKYPLLLDIFKNSVKDSKGFFKENYSLFKTANPDKVLNGLDEVEKLLNDDKALNFVISSLIKDIPEDQIIKEFLFAQKYCPSLLKIAHVLVGKVGINFLFRGVNDDIIKK